MSLEDREKVVLEMLQKLPKDDAVLVGGYALNAYVPPRFSVDCDLVVLGDPGPIGEMLEDHGFERAEEGDVPYGDYLRYVREDEKVSFDLLVDAVLDRQTGVIFEGKLVEDHSQVRTTVGRATLTRIEMRIADPELLFAMKFVPGRRQDIRDLFMLAGEDLDWDTVRTIVLETCDPDIVEDRVKLTKDTVESTGYRDSLQGAYGQIPDDHFERCQTQLLDSLDELSTTVNPNSQ